MLKFYVGEELKNVGVSVSDLEVPPQSFGDLAIPVFKFVKKGESPNNAAKRISEEIKTGGLISRVEVKGPYVNLWLNREKTCELLLKNNCFKRKNVKILVEHTSVNPGKPWHVGHSRNALIGDVISRCYKKLGYKVEVMNYIDDLGKQVAVLVWAWNNIRSEVPRNNCKTDYWHGLLYAEGVKRVDEEEVNKIVERLEDFNSEESRLGYELSVESVKSQLRTAYRLGVYYDYLVWERDVVQSKLFEEALKRMLESENVYKVERGEDKGCIVVDMSSAGEEFVRQKKPYKIIVRSNGVPTYTGKDVALQMWKLGLSKSKLLFEEFEKQPNNKTLWSSTKKGVKKGFGSADIVINVIGYEQDYPQKVVREAIKVMGFEEQARNSHHLSYKHVRLESGKFSGRSGNWVGKHADAVIDRVVSMAGEELVKRHPNINGEELKVLSELIGVSAYRFHLLKYDPERLIIFRWSDLLDFNGFTSVYVQYAGVRAKKILESVEKIVKPRVFNLNDEEFGLVKKLLFFSEVVEEVVKQRKPHLLVVYVYELAQLFNEFYNKHRVIGSEFEDQRLFLVNQFFKVLNECFDLLGLKMPPYL